MTTEKTNLDNSGTIENLSNLVDLTKSFKAAVENAGFFTRRKLKKAATSDEKSALISDAAGNLLGGLLAAFGGGASQPTESSLRRELNTAEISAGLVQRALKAKKIAKLVPAEQRTEENSKALKEAGYPKLASLYAPKV